jgi:hypothetical protein
MEKERHGECVSDSLVCSIKDEPQKGRNKVGKNMCGCAGICRRGRIGKEEESGQVVLYPAAPYVMNGVAFWIPCFPMCVQLPQEKCSIISYEKRQ